MPQKRIVRMYEHGLPKDDGEGIDVDLMNGFVKESVDEVYAGKCGGMVVYAGVEVSTVYEDALESDME